MQKISDKVIEQIICHYCKVQCLRFEDFPPSYLKWTRVFKRLCYLPENRIMPLPASVQTFDGWLCHKCIKNIISEQNGPVKQISVTNTMDSNADQELIEET